MNNQPFFCLFLNCNNQIFRDFVIVQKMIRTPRFSD